MRQTNEKLIIGRKEIASLPDFNLMNKIVKIDSGAYTSSIDVIKTKIENDKLYVLFEKETNEVTFENFKIKRIKSSNGILQERFVIKGNIFIGNKNYNTPFSLTDRSGMKFPILLGRKFLNNNFIIDTSKVFLLK
jgi:hypothetical protein